jgi:hypothetical protein
VILSASSLTSVAKNVVKTITYTDIYNAIDFRDYDLNTSAKPALGDLHGISFRIESVNSGTLVGSNGTSIAPTPGNSASMKYLVQSGADLSSSWASLNWTPPPNLTGTYTVMKVRLFDGQDWSNTVASINITVTAGNSTPTYTASSFTYSPGIDENGALLVRYDDLISYTGAADADGDVIRIKVVRLNSGSITVNGTTYSTVGAIGAAPSIGPGQTFIWRPATNAFGTPSAFGIVLTDTVADSAEITASVTVSSVNTAPTLANASGTISGAARYTYNMTPFAISYSTIQSALGITDAESEVITLQISSWVGGQRVGSFSSSGCTSPTYYDGSNTITVTSTNGHNFCWIPPDGVTGVVDAFRVQVSDASGAIAGQTGLIKVNITTGSNAAPSVVSGCKIASTNDTTVTCGGSIAFGSATAAETPVWSVVKAGGTLSWTYDYLKSLSGVRDTDTSSVSFVITGINTNLTTPTSASLQKNSVNVTTYPGSGTPATTALIGPGEKITFNSSNNISSTYDNDTYLFKIKAYDGAALSAEMWIKVSLVASSTDQPPNFRFAAPMIMPTATAVSGTAMVFSYATIRAHLDANDVNEAAGDLPRGNMNLYVTSASGANFTVYKSASSACTTPTLMAAGVTISSSDFLCVYPDATSAGNLNNVANAATAYPLVNIKVSNYTGSANSTTYYPTNNPGAIPLMIRGRGIGP